jgi:hypothetical protein
MASRPVNGQPWRNPPGAVSLATYPLASTAMTVPTVTDLQDAYDPATPNWPSMVVIDNEAAPGGPGGENFA